LTSPHDRITSNRWRTPHDNSNTNCDGTQRTNPPALGIERA
jgi:hypothetical protein